LRSPRLARLLVAALVAAPDREEILGDLEEEFRLVRVGRGSLRARAWYWREALGAVRARRRRASSFGLHFTRPEGLLADTLRLDVRHALRALARSPAVSVAAVLTLALAVGAATVVYSAARAVLFRPLPFEKPDQLVFLGHPERDGGVGNVGYATLVDWRDRSRSFAELAAMRGWNPTMVSDEGAEPLPGVRVTWNYFRLLGVQPALGRDFTAADDRPGAWYVVMLSDGLWRRRFRAEPDIIGRSVTLNGRAFQVVGVMPPSFDPLVSGRFNSRAEIWAPMGYEASLDYACRTCRHLRAFGRLAPGVTLGEARAELAAVQAGLVDEHPDDYRPGAPAMVRLQDEIVRPFRAALLVMLGAVAFVLVVASANVASLLVARAADREHEMALRAALGAGRGRILRQLLAEGLVLAAGATAGGLALAGWALAGITASAPASVVPRLAEARLDAGVLAFASALGAAAVLLFGMAPALAASRLDLQAALKDVRQSPETRALGLRRTLVVADVALSLVLVAGAGLMVRTVDRLLHVDPGFDPSGVLIANLSFVGPAYAEDAAVFAYQQQILEKVAALPGVEAVAFSGQVPLGGNFDRWGVEIEGREATPETEPSFERYSVSPDYLRIMRIPVVRGRGITSADTAESAPVALVGETAAAQVWPGEDPIGQRVHMGGDSRPWRTIVGVVGDVRHYALDSPPTMEMYLPQSQVTDSYVVLVVRAAADPASLVAPVREAVRSVVKDVPVSGATPYAALTGRALAPRRFLMVLLGGFALATLVMAAIGIYGVVSYAVSRRTREVGVRLALGATSGDVVRLLLGQGLRTVAIGLGLGLGGALAVTRALASQLYGIRPTDPLTFAVAVACLVAVAVASHLPALARAARVDPTVALRAE